MFFKTIIDLCGGSGAWSKPYAEAGYDVRVITLPDRDVIDYIPPGQVYGILAAPPCTEFSMARNRYPEKKRDFVGGMIPVNACLRIIFRAKPFFWALENPVGLLARWLGKPNYIFEPWWFGDPYSKRTALWGRFCFPVRKYLTYAECASENDVLPIRAKRCFAARKSGIPSIADITSGNEREFREITSAGFARAFFEANR